MRILHCSDIHICQPFNWRKLRGKRILGCLNWLFNRAWSHHSSRWEQFLEMVKNNPPDVLVITGDLAQLGTSEELSIAAKPLYELKQQGVRILYIPGNHDRYIAHDRNAEAYIKKLAADFGSSNPEEPGSILVSNGEVDFVLLSQALPRGFTSCGGFIDEKQWQALEALQVNGSATRPRIVLGHYPLCNEHGLELSRSRRLEDAARLRKLLDEIGARLYLCGHIHHPYDLSLSNTCEQLVAGSITAAGSYYEINLDGRNVDWKRMTLP